MRTEGGWTVRPPTLCLSENHLGQCVFGLRDNRLECRHIGNCQFAQHFSIDLNSLRIQTEDQLRVLNIASSAGGGDTGNPEPAEISLLCSAVAEGVLPRLHYLLVSSAKDVLLTAPIAGRLIDNFLVALVAH